MKQNNTPSRKLFTTSVLLALLALVSVTAATAAWMTIADRTRVRSMRMDITTGVNLRFDLDPHETFEEYVKTLTFEQIAERIKAEKEFDPRETPLTPVTTKDCEKFVLEDGSDAKTVKSVDDPAVALADVQIPPEGGKGKTVITELNLNETYTVDVYFYLEGCDPDCLSDKVALSKAALNLAFYGLLTY